MVQKKERGEMKSAFDLAFDYINKNYTEISNNDKINIIKTIKGVLNDGAITNDIDKKIQSSSGSDQNYISFFKSIRPAGNLLDQSKFYFHNELRLLPGPPKRIWDINSGEIVSVTEEYFLEMRASYTIEDVIAFIRKKEFLAKTLFDINRAKGSITFLLKKYDIDFLLFLLDTANDIYSSKQKFARSLVEISEFEDEARENYERRITESKINGDCKIVPKKRVLFESA